MVEPAIDGEFRDKANNVAARTYFGEEDPGDLEAVSPTYETIEMPEAYSYKGVQRRPSTTRTNECGEDLDSPPPKHYRNRNT